MMKKLLVLMLVLGITASIANAGLVELMVASQGPDSGSTTPIDPTNAITVAPSEWLDLNIYYTAPAGWLLTSISVDIVVDGPGTIFVVDEDLTEPSGAWDPSFNKVTQIEGGYTIERAMLNGLPGAGEPVIALDHILFHCDAIGDVTITMSNNMTTATGGTVETDWAAMPFAEFGGPVTITQIPEPMTSSSQIRR